MSMRSSRLAVAAAVLSIAAAARADSIVLLSAPPGLAEGTEIKKPFIAAVDGQATGNKTPAVVTNTAAWAAPFDGASYVSNCPTCGSDLNRCSGASGPTPARIAFVHRFDLPANFSSPSLTMTTTNDDSGDVYLNGNFIGTATTFGFIPGLATFTIGSSDASFFKAGDNELRYELVNFNAPCPLSVAYRAVVDYTR